MNQILETPDMIINPYRFAGGNNAYVQAWLNQLTTDGATLPTVAIAALNTFFDSVDALMSTAERISIYALNETGIDEGLRRNMANPSTYFATLVSSPTFGLNGVVSDGTSYINTNMAVDRRSGIETDYCEISACIGSSTQNGKVQFGAISSATKAMKNIHRLNSTLGRVGSYTVDVNVANTSGFEIFMSQTYDGGTKYGINGTYAIHGASALAPNQSNNMFDLALNNSGTPASHMNESNLALRWSGYALTEANVEVIRAAWIQYRTDLGI